MNIFTQLFKSLYSPRDISTYRTQGIGKTILYIVLLSLLAILPIFFTLTNVINKAYEAVDHTITNVLPDFAIENGYLVSDLSEPTQWDVPGGIQILFDSTDTITIGEVQSMPVDTLAILHEEIVVNIDGQQETIPYSTLFMNDASKTDIEQFIESMGPLKNVIIIITFFIIYFIEIARALITVTVLGLIGLLFKNILRVQLTYGESWKLSAYALTLPTLFFIVMNSFQAIVPFSSIINWGVMLTMLFLAIKEIVKNDNASPETQK